MGAEVVTLGMRSEKRAEASRAAVLQCIRSAKKLTVGEAQFGKNFRTDDSLTAAFTVTTSLREAFSLVRVLGPISLQAGDGSAARLLTALHIVQRELLRSRGGQSMAVIAAMQVLQVATNDHMWTCREYQPPPGQVKHRRR